MAMKHCAALVEGRATTGQVVEAHRARNPRAIAIASRSVEPRSGDLVMTGTPEGVGPVRRGETMTGGLDGLGEIRIAVA